MINRILIFAGMLGLCPITAANAAEMIWALRNNQGSYANESHGSITGIEVGPKENDEAAKRMSYVQFTSGRFNMSTLALTKNRSIAQQLAKELNEYSKDSQVKTILVVVEKRYKWPAFDFLGINKGKIKIFDNNGLILRQYDFEDRLR